MYYFINLVTFSIAKVCFETLPEAEMYWDSISPINQAEWTIVKSVHNDYKHEHMTNKSEK